MTAATWRCPRCDHDHPVGDTHDMAVTRLAQAHDDAAAIGEWRCAFVLGRTLRAVLVAERIHASKEHQR